MMDNTFNQVLKALVSIWQKSGIAYADYMQNGMKFRDAQALKVHNTAARKLLVDNINTVPADFKEDVYAIIEHYTIWSAKWDQLKDKLDPSPDDKFVFANDHHFPKASAQRLEEALNELS